MPLLAQRVCVVAVDGVDAAQPRAAVEGWVGRVAHRLQAKDGGDGVLLGVAKGKGAAIGLGGSAPAALAAVAEGG